MAQKNRVDLTTEANVIKNETVAKRNTASRVGNMLVNLIDSLLTFLDDAGNFLSKSDTEPNVWYVNTNGDDANVGSDKFPFETIKAAHDAADDRDIIMIQNWNYNSNESFTVTKYLIFKAQTPQVDGIVNPTLRGTWILNKSEFVFHNINVRQEFQTALSLIAINVTDGKFDCDGLPDRKTDLILSNTKWSVNSGVEVRDVKLIDCEVSGSIIAGRHIEVRGGSHVTGDITAGIDIGSNSLIYDSSVGGDATITGNLTKVNGVVVGNEAVSGTPTSRQAKVFDDSVLFKDKVGVGVDPINKLDVAGGMAIGSGVAGISTAPTDGLLVEGNAGFGDDSPTDPISVVGGKIKIVSNDDKIVMYEDDVPEADAFFKITNSGPASGRFSPIFWSKSNKANAPGVWFLGDTKEDTGDIPAVKFDARFDNGAVVTRPVLGIFNAATQLITVLPNGDTGFGTTTPVAKVDIDQSDNAGAVPVLKLTQTDLSEEMIKLDATIGIGNPIEAIGAKSFTQTHFLKINVEGLGVKYMPIGDLA